MTPSLRALTRGVARQFHALTQRNAQRLFHPTATTTFGELEVLPLPGLDAASLFVEGQRFAVLLRHANGVQADDAAWDNRGASLRILPAHVGPDGQGLDAPLLDLPLTTGARFTSRSASEFVAWMGSPRERREQLAQAQPHLADAAWELFRAPASYLKLHYHSKLPQRYRDAAGCEHFVRYRLVPLTPAGDPVVDGGLLARSGLLPPDTTSRDPDDPRAPTFLHTQLRAQLERGPLKFCLQLQLRPSVEPGEARDLILDGTRTWSDVDWPWLDRATLRMTSIVDEAHVEGLTFNPAHAPEGLGIVPAHGVDDSASLNHLRAVVYHVAAHARRGAPPPAWLDGPTPRAPSSSARDTARVAVVGAGVSGLAVARRLTEAGVAVTVFERAAQVGGKSRSVSVGGHAFDLGAHLCSPAYVHTSALLEQLGIEREPVVEVVHLDYETGAPTRVEVDALRESFLRYQTLKHREFPRVSEPGFTLHAEALSEPALEWFEREGLAELVPLTAVGFTASGYGYLDDPELSAYHVLKYAELATFCMPARDPSYWTPKGGFGQVSAAMAAALPDVRTGADISAIERSERGVELVVDGARERFDQLVVASPWHSFAQLLELDEHADELFDALEDNDYFTAIFRAEGLPREGFFLVSQCTERATPLAAFHHRYASSDVYLAWAYAPLAASDADLWSLLETELAVFGGSLIERHGLHRWRYFPRAGVSEMREGYYAKLDALQGQQRTWFAGSLLDFELVECNLRASQALAERIVDALEAREGVRRSADARLEPVGLFQRLSEAPPDARPQLLETYLQTTIATELELPLARVGLDVHVLELGLDSVRTVQIFEVLIRDTRLTLAPMVFFEHTTIRALGQHLAVEFERQHLGRRTRAPAPAPTPTSSSRGRPPRTRATPRQDLEPDYLAHLRRILAAELDITPASIEAHHAFVDLGLDSIRSVRLLDQLASESGLILSPSILFEHSHVGELATRLAREHAEQFDEPLHGQTPAQASSPALEARLQRIEQALAGIEALLRHERGGPSPTPSTSTAAPSSASPSPRRHMPPATPWLRVHDTQPSAARRLICFHNAGGDASMFDPWARLLPADIGLYAVQLPGRAPHRGAAPQTIAELLDPLWAQLEPLLDRPFALFGHSFGALLAFAVCERAVARGRRPQALFVSSFWAPHRWEPRPELARFVEHRMTPALWLDHKLLDSWTSELGAPLPLPIAVFGGREDVVVPAEALREWEGVGTSVSLHVMPGGHFHLVGAPALPRIIGAVFSSEDANPQPAPRPPASATSGEQEAPLDPSLARELARFDEALAGPASTLGTWNIYDLGWLARVRHEHEPGPQFPAALEAMCAQLGEGGQVGAWRSPQPHHRLITTLSCVDTLWTWHGLEGRDYDAQIHALLADLDADLDALRDPLVQGIELPHAKHFKFPGTLGRSVLLSGVLRRVLAHELPHISPSQRERMREWLRPLPTLEPEFFASGGNFMLMLGEFFEESILGSPEVAAYVDRVHPELPAQSVPFAARYYEVTRCPRTRARLEQLLEHCIGGLRPSGRLQERYFALHFLNKAGVDLSVHCPQAMAYLAHTQRAYGVGIYERSLVIDTDSSAIALTVSHDQGVPTPIPSGARLLDSMWSETTQCYQSTIGELTNVNVTLFAARGYLSLPELDPAHARTIWARTLAQLDERQWMSPDHLSPMYLWENIISLLFAHEHRFPAHRTRHHHTALDCVLSLQTADGGFRSALYRECEGADLEESALGLLALKAASAGMLDAHARARVDEALPRAQRYVADGFAHYLATGEGLLEAWGGKFLFASARLFEAICLAALLRPPRANANT